MNLSIRDCRMLMALAEHRHFARAAEACHMSQPAFSARLNGIEHALDIRLVDRGARFARFTQEGERILEWARRIAALADGLQQDMSAAKGALTGRLRLAAIPSQLPVAGELAAAMNRRYPGVEVALSSRPSKAIDLALDHYECDIGLTYLDEERPDAQQRWPLYDERYVALVPRAVMRLPPGPLAWRDAANLPLALLNAEMQNRRIIDDAFRQAGADVRATIESDTLVALLGAVRLGHVATILPAGHATLLGTPEDTARHDLAEPVVTKSIGLVALPREPELPLVVAFGALAKAHFGG